VGEVLSKANKFNMKKIILALIPVLLVLTTFAQEQMVVDPNASLRTLKGSFSRIRVANAIKVIITQSDNESIAVSASEEKYKDDIKTEIENNTLRIYYKAGNEWRGKDKKLKVYVSFKNISLLEVSGASDVAGVGKITLNELTLNVSGASTLKADLAVNKLEMDMNGASKASLSGTVQLLNLECSGATDVNAYGLKVMRANATVSGASDVDLYVENELNATASGASRIHYKGNSPVVNVKTSGASTIFKKD
jgi:hypothetical protein